MKKLTGVFYKINHFLPLLFFASLFTFRIPNFYVIPGVTNVFTTAQALARLCILLVFVFKIIEYFVKKEKRPFFNKRNVVPGLVCAFFIIQSFSILVATNYHSFLNRYKDIVLGILSFFTLAFFKKDHKKFILVFTLPIYINLIYQAIMIFDKNVFLSMADKLIYSNHLAFVDFNLKRDRIYIDSYDEAFLPFLFFHGQTPLSYVTILFLGFFSFLSNFRTRIIMLFFSLLSSLLILIKRTKVTILVLILVFLLGYSINFFSLRTAGFSFYDRFIFQNDLIENNIISSRVRQLFTALDTGKYSFFGVGLGNFYDSLSVNIKTDAILSSNIVDEGAAGYVHNIFGSIVAESGYFSLFLFVVILTLFIKSDIRLLRGRNDFKKSLVISFWTIFTYGLFNPNVAATYQVFFWGLRGLLVDN